MRHGRREPGGRWRGAWRGGWEGWAAGVLMMACLPGVLAAEAVQPAGESATVPTTQPGAKVFPVFDCLHFPGKPDLSRYGLHPMAETGREYFRVIEAGPTPKRDYERADEKTTRYFARALARRETRLVMIDIEHWRVQGESEEAAAGRAKLIELAQWIHDESPGLRLGYYGVPPLRDYWRAVTGAGSAKYQEWQAENDLLRELAREVDVLFPSLYTFYDDPRGWKVYAKANLSEARRYGKTVYAFLWPQYHNSNKTLGMQFVPGDVWREQLETCYEWADGVVIWAGGGGPDGKMKAWDEDAPWWRETVNFMERIRGEAMTAQPAAAE